MLFTEEQLRQKVDELGAQITADYRGKNPLVVSVLKGSYVFMADLTRRIDVPCTVDFMVVSSYGAGTKTSGEVQIIKDLENSIDGRDLIIPLERYGVKLLSIGFLVDKNAPVLWRGSMASNALKQLINDADWGELDYFLIDMPPGTSDIHLTLVQTLGITGAVIVSTPQQVALADARKGIAMFTGDKINVPILGLVENMAWFTPEQHPDERYYIFGKEGGVALAKELGVKLLGQIPLVGSVCDSGDMGTPIAGGDTVMGQQFMHLAHEVADAVAERNATLPPTHRVELKR